MKVWQPYRLQSLPPNRFAKVIKRILRGEDEVIKPPTKTDPHKDPGSDEHKKHGA